MVENSENASRPLPGRNLPRGAAVRLDQTINAPEPGAGGTMKCFATLAILAASLPLFAQQAVPPAPQPASQKPVASINGEIITAEMLDQLYDRLSPQLRSGYDQAGGKAAFLDNYLGKRVLIQAAVKASFDKRPDVQQDLAAARDSALFDRYIRDVVAEPIATDEAMRQYYEGHKEEFAQPAMVKARDIYIGTEHRSREDALARITAIRQGLFAAEREFIGVGSDASRRTPELIQRFDQEAFSRAAADSSEDWTAKFRGSLGWQVRGRLDPAIEEVAYSQPVGTISRVIELKNGYYLIFVDDRRPAGTPSFEAVKRRVRDRLMAEHSAEVLKLISKLTDDLKAKSEITIYPDNVE
jgi:peptidyl-prolyl cis-trans isomerase C